MGIQELCSGATSVDGLRMKEQGSSGDGYAPKVRKPYTITKHRERWTDEEHSKFLEALQLHGRAWRRIEEYIGTKTAVQIRSHAQKFFSKVARESKPIEIPPPRPKRKPVHPYPRKMGNPVSGRGLTIGKLGQSSSAIPSASEQENGSPTSVLSALGSDAVNPFLSNRKNPCTSPVTSGVGSNEQDSSAEETEQKQNNSPTDASVPCLKLFGKTVMVTDARRPSSSNVGHPVQNSKSLSSVDVEWQDKIPNVSLGSPALPMLPMFCPVPSVYGDGTDRPWMFFCGNLPLPFLHQPNSVSSQFVDDQPRAEAPRDKVTQHECSWTGSNTADEGGHTVNSKCTEHARSVEDGENVGFVPYKRRVVERDEQNGAADDIEDRPIGLCL